MTARRMRSRTWFAGSIVLALVLAGCSGATDESSGPTETSVPVPFTVPQAEESPDEDVPSALANMVSSDLPTPLVDPSEIRSGGPPPDGIPPIDEPRFLRTGDVDFIDDAEPVLAIDIDGDTRAYPVQILIWHEIVNDTVGGVPVSVTYCPLCNTAVAVDRRLDDRVLSFGTSGSLYHSSLVMYDRQTQSLWSHFTGQAIAGVLTGAELELYPVATVAWRDWRDAHPDGLVLSRETGNPRDYGRNPYPGYDNVNTSPFLFDGEVDGRWPAKERIVGLGLGIEPLAVRLEPLLEQGVVAAELDGRPIVVWALPGTASALEGEGVADGRDVGATGVFFSTVDGQTLTFERRDGGFTDAQTGSRWDVFGTATSGPLAGSRLEAIEHVDTFWFAWASFAPDTTVLPA